MKLLRNSLQKLADTAQIFQRLAPEKQVYSDALQQVQKNSELLADYLKTEEEVVGFGEGVSESMTLILKQPNREKFMRKVLSERLITAQWSREGQNVMLPPCTKAMRPTQLPIK